MALLKKEEPANILRASLASMLARRSDIDAKISERKSEVSACQKELESLYKKGDVAEDALVKAEAALGNSERRLQGLTAARASLDRDIAQTKIEFDQTLRRLAAQQKIDLLTADHKDFSEKLNALVRAAHDLIPVAKKIGEYALTSTEWAQLAILITTDGPLADHRISSEIEWTSDFIMRKATEPPTQKSEAPGTVEYVDYKWLGT